MLKANVNVKASQNIKRQLPMTLNWLYRRKSRYVIIFLDDSCTNHNLMLHTQMNQDTILENIKKVSDSSMQCVKIVSLTMDNDSPLKTPEGRKSIQEAGIKGVEDVGEWIVKSIEVDLKEAKTAQVLEHYFKLPK